MATKHTPGPWTVTQYGIRSRAGHICQIIHPGRYSDQSERYERENAERTGDARLIAAAPDMLKALQECESVLRIMGYVNAADIAKAAIDKAL